MRTPNVVTLTGVLVGLLAPGCAYNWRSGVTETASLQHGCAPEQIAVRSDNGDEYARVVQLDVCGQRRVYQDQGGRYGYAWVDTTPPTHGGEQPAQVQAPTPEAIHAAPASMAIPTTEVPFAGSVRARLDARAAAILTCTGSSVAIEARWSSSGVVELAARGITDPTVAQCVGAAIGAIEVPEGTAPGQLLHPIAG